LPAEPVSLLWEQGRVLMRPGVEALELEMLRFPANGTVLFTARRTGLMRWFGR
jgi:phage terminase large subunit-like protein